MWGIKGVPNVLIVPIRLPTENIFGGSESLGRIIPDSEMGKACEILEKAIGRNHVFPKPGETNELVWLCRAYLGPAMLTKKGRSFTLPKKEIKQGSAMHKKLIEFLKS
jgi:hypothetical protein